MSTPSASKRLAWLWRMVWSDAPLGRPRRRQRRDTVAEVKGDVTALETTISTFGDLVNNKEILNLPLVTVDSRHYWPIVMPARSQLESNLRFAGRVHRLDQ
jgi:hypothetical protein